MKNHQKEALAALIFVSIVCRSAYSAEVFVDDPPSLEEALFTASSNDEDDIINLKAGTYFVEGPLVYDSAENRSLTLKGVIGGGVILEEAGYQGLLRVETYGDQADISIVNIVFRDGFLTDGIGSCLFVRARNADVRVEGSAFRDCWGGSVFGASDAAGAFVRCDDSCTVSLSDLELTGNRAKGIGGGLAACRPVHQQYLGNEASRSRGVFRQIVGPAVALAAWARDRDALDDVGVYRPAKRMAGDFLADGE